MFPQSLELLNQEAAWLLIPIGVILVALMARSRATVPTVLATALTAAVLVFALCDPASKSSSTREELVALFDASKSISNGGKLELVRSLLQFIREKPDITLNVVPFAKQTASKSIPATSSITAETLLASLEEASSLLDSGETNIASALSTVGASGDNASILLLSDGFETVGNAQQAARLAAARGVRVFPLIPDDTRFRTRGLAISSLYAPTTVNAGDLAEIRASVRNSEAEAATSVLELWLDDKKILSRPVSVPSGEERLVTVKTPPIEDGLKRVRAVLKQESSNSNDNPAEVHRWISAKAKAKLLLVSGTPEDHRVLQQLLTLKGYQVQAIVADGKTEIPTSFIATSGVILNNVAKSQLPGKFLPQLREFVSAGGGLLLVGGDRSFGLGGYINTDLEEISPVKFLPPQTTQRRLNNAVILVIDKSRSMVFENKIEGAKAAALMAIRTMKDDDFIGVIGFDASPFVIIRLAPIPDVRPIAESRIRNLTAAGRTDLLPALAAARQSLERSTASRKHIIVLSDGKVPVAGDSYVQEISRLREAGVTVSAVALGVEADAPFMDMLSKYGRGAFYHTLDPTRLPEIFVKDIKTTTGEKTIQERRDFPVGVGPSGLKSTGIDRYPVVRGFVQTVAKKSAATELITKKEDDIFPLLASWTYGAGRVLAYTSDANGRWSLPWLSWEGFPKFWTDLIEKVEQTSDTDSGQVDFDLRSYVNRRTVYLDLAVYDEKLRREVSPKITAEVTLPGGEVRSVSFLPEKRGRFLGTLPNGKPGDYKLTISYGSIKFPQLGLTFAGDLFGEFPGRGINVSNLSELAYITGGVVNPNPEQVASSAHISEKYEHHFMPFVLLAFLLLLITAFVRELGLRLFLLPLEYFSRSENLEEYTESIYNRGRRKRG